MNIVTLSHHTWVDNPEDKIPEYIREQMNYWWLILLLLALGGVVIWVAS